MTAPVANSLASNSARKMNGGQALAEMLKLSGVGPMFGMGGFQLLPFYEAMRALGLKHFLINDERCGAFASDAYARVTNRPGVCDATLGPGATNLVTAMVESLNAGIPQIAIIGDANRDHAWKNMTQEARQTEILKPAVKELIRVEGDEAHPGAHAPRLRGCDQRAAGAGGARCAGGCLPRRARVRCGRFLGRRCDVESTGAPHAARSA